MNETINPPCNSLLATFFELDSPVCPKEASFCLREISSSHADKKSVVQAAVSPSPFDFPEEKFA